MEPSGSSKGGRIIPRHGVTPVGTVTFLFTDIEGSTGLVQELGDRFGAVLETHHAILRRAISAHQGVEVSTEGDAFFAVFPSAVEAVNATVAGNASLPPPNGRIDSRSGEQLDDAALTDLLGRAESPEAEVTADAPASH